MASSKQKGTAGFAAINQGRITDCYSKLNMKQKEHLGGFCYENEGEILRCAAFGKLKGKEDLGGFCPLQKGTLRDSFWIRRGNDDKKYEKYSDMNLAVQEEEMKREFFEKLSWDTENVWQLSGDDTLTASLYSRDDGLPEGWTVEEIGSKQELLDLAAAVNDGAKSDPRTLYRLTGDVDLHGCSWTPIGQDPGTPFHGCFDGAGFEIRNFRVKASKNPYAGLFGCVASDGQVHNLRIDCMIQGFGSYAAPMAAQNEGRIVNCISQAEVDASRYSGGFVARNQGDIIRCSAFGKTRMPVLIPWWLFAGLLGLLMLAGSAGFAVHYRFNGQEVFAPVIVDPNAKPLAEEEITMPAPAPEEQTDSSACFIMNAEMAVSSDNYAGYMGLRCPPWSNRGFAATAFVTAADLKKNGSSYSGDAVVYQSGLIKPGTGINIVTLSTLPDGSRLPAGSYEMIVQFDFYDTETNERSAVNSTAPIDVTIN